MRLAKKDSTGTQLTVNANAKTMELVWKTSTSTTTTALVSALTLHHKQ
jgi:hypothetical protein